MKTRLCVSLTAATLFLFAGPAPAGADLVVVGQKIDNGLGDLPHYSKWTDPTGRHPAGHRVVGESLDDGLAELPHYSKWADPTGRDPLGRQAIRLAALKR